MTLDNPVIFIGTDATGAGYEVINRGSEFVATIDCQIKYDELTMGLINTFDTQTAAFTTDHAFNLVAANAGGILVKNAFLTNVALVEGDIMMLDVSMKAVASGTDDLIEIDAT